MAGRPGVEPRERLPPARGEPEDAPAAILGRRGGGDETPAPETPEHSAEVPRVELERGGNGSGGGVGVVGDLVQHPDFAQGERAAQVPRVEEPETAGVEAVEAADAVDGRGAGFGGGLGAHGPRRAGGELKRAPIVAFVNYRRRLRQRPGCGHFRGGPARG